MTIDGVRLTALKQIPDSRGTVMHMVRATDPHFVNFGEVYFSTVNYGAIKAWKRHRRMTLNLACPHGRVRLVIYDDRPDSPTCGVVQEVELGREHYVLATVPPMLWTGFAGLGAEPSLLANCASLPHDPEEYDRLEPNDPAIPYNWIAKDSIPRAKVVRLSKSSIDPTSIVAAAEAVGRGHLGMGSDVAVFERELRAFLGGDREVMCVNTGTSALHLAIQACGIGPGDEVLVPTLTFLSSFQAISATGATPVACDVRQTDACLDVADAASRITSRTKAIMPVHYASGLGAIEEVYELAKVHGLRVIEDAAHAFGCSHRGRRVGAEGDVVCFSFDGIKNITSGEGGAVVTVDAAVAERVRNARLLGVLKDTEKRYAGKRSWEFDVTSQGWRCHMSNINAALGRAQLRRFEPELAPARIRLARRYMELLSGAPGLRLLALEYGPIVPHIFPVFISGGMRDRVRADLEAAQIESGIHYKPNHLLTFYGGGQVRLPVAEQLYAELLTLPLHPDLTESEQDLVVQTLVRSLSGTELTN